MINCEKEFKTLNRIVEIISKDVLETISRDIRTIENRYLALTETVTDAIISIDSEGRIIFYNSTTMKMFGYDTDIIGKNITILMPERCRQPHREGLNRYISTGISKIIGNIVEMTGLRKDGTEFPVEMSLSEWRNDGQYFFTSIMRDITERKHMEHSLREANKKLEELSVKDCLTDLYNRRYACQVLEKEFKRAARYKNPLSCLMIDIDYFKQINDLYGHHFGDKVLVYFSSFLLEMKRYTDVISRYGGEEFLVILPDVDIHGAVNFSERVRNTISKLRIEDKERNIHTFLNISVGISSFTEQTRSAEELICQADMALYEAKRQGRNRVSFYKPSV